MHVNYVSLKASLKLPCWLSSSGWDDGNASCVLQKSEILEEWVDCRGVSTVPWLKATVTVYFNGSTEEAVLHLNEDSVLLATEVWI